MGSREPSEWSRRLALAALGLVITALAWAVIVATGNEPRTNIGEDPSRLGCGARSVAGAVIGAWQGRLADRAM